MEIDLYEIKKWLPDWADGFPIMRDLLIDLSHNPHFMAANILYASYPLLDATFASWFCLHADTLSLYETLMKKFGDNVVYNHQSKLKYFHLKKDSYESKGSWKYWSRVTRNCETLPMSEITIPYEHLNWYHLSLNPHKCVIDFLKQNRENIKWTVFCSNSSDAAVDFLLEENIEWWYASSNTNERIVARFGEHRDELSEHRLSQNQSDMAVQFLLDNLYDKINWIQFCENPNDIVVSHLISIITENRNDTRIFWSILCRNPNPRVFDILRNNKDKIVWADFLRNPICFTYDYEMMRERCLPIKKEIDAIFSRPDNVMAMIEIEREGDESDFDVIARLNP